MIVKDIPNHAGTFGVGFCMNPACGHIHFWAANPDGELVLSVAMDDSTAMALRDDLNSLIKSRSVTAHKSK